MPSYNSLSNLKGNKLWLVKNGWFTPDYSLTDGQNQYGKIYHAGLFSSATIFETDGNSIVAVSAGIGDVYLKMPDGKQIGYAERKFFSSTLELVLNNSVKATLSIPNIWRMAYIWRDENGQQIMEIEGDINSSLLITFDRLFFESPNFLPVLFAGIKYLIYLSTNAT
nr:hypothetical protein [uncultured Mucilaginibacter sp.]